jgi:PAS domain S-box-containing protein
MSVPSIPQPIRPDHDQFDPARADSQSDYIAVCGAGGKLLYVNPAFATALGYVRGTMAGTLFTSYVAEESRAAVIGMMSEDCGPEGLHVCETTLRAADGLTRAVLVRGRRIRYGSIPATLLFLIDITERKALEEKLAARAEELQQISAAYQQANRKLTLLSTITRHDINNQLTVLKGYLGILETEQPDPVLAEYCKKAVGAAERIESMIRFTSEYEKLGITVPAWQDCHAVVETAARQAPLGTVVLTNDLPSGLEVFADPLIGKVMYNLMENAVRYGEKISVIRIFSEEKDGASIIVCEDDGAGVPAEDKERIFGRGFGKNTGLGLALSREILDITGISIQETGEHGAGARFEIVVPAGVWRNRQPS